MPRGVPKSAYGLVEGDRIRLISMGDDPVPMAAGAVGTVRGFCSSPGLEQIQMDWDEGHGLNLIPGEDVWEKV